MVSEPQINGEEWSGCRRTSAMPRKRRRDGLVACRPRRHRTEEFATSRTPVREALLELSFEGLVRVGPRSGLTVIGITTADVLDSFTILACSPDRRPPGQLSV